VFEVLFKRSRQGHFEQNPGMSRLLAQQVIRIHAEAPAKPPEGGACNGCGVCCASEPCPVGMLVSLRRAGPCRALSWDALQRRYVCGLIAAPQRGVRPRWLARAVSRLAARFIAAGIGCDSSLEVVRP
jgi:hypothetical protein